MDLTTDMTDAERAERSARVHKRAMELIASVDAMEPYQPDYESERRWAEWERGRREAERHRQWEAQLERSRSKSPQLAPKPAAAPVASYATKDDLSDFYTKEVIHRLFIDIIKEERQRTVGAADKRQDALERAIGEMFRRERQTWQERVAALEIRIDALTKGRRNDDEQ
ncbi:hypothetical protein ACNHKD_12710 [Methylocystis sp. JAN1]|uniref:hypothetical protein n=1 Tax=Methylocystis sp. JAN1 TaxID=3397211 RepID=UPI003FA281C7